MCSINIRDLGSSRRHGAFDPAGFALTAAAGSLVSVAITGYGFGITTHFYYLPILGALYDEPQFAQDPFIQSLRFFASGVWLQLSGLGRHVDAYWLFLGLLYLARLLAFIGFLACADLLGVRGRKERALFAGLLCLTALLRGGSYAGGGGLFNSIFGHTEFANGLTLISLYFAVRGRVAAAFGINGAVFFVNAFFSVWNALPLGMIILYLLFTKQIEWRKAMIGGAIGLIIFLVVSAPVVWNILSNPDFGSRTDFDYVDYLKQTNIYSQHFLFESISLLHRIGAVVVVLIAVSSLVALGAPARPFLPAMFGYMAVYAFGIIAPHFTHNPVILNLCLLRVSTMFHLLAALGSLALATRWLTRGDQLHARVLAPIMIVLLCTSKYVLSLAPFVILISLFPGALRRVPSQLAARRFRIDYAAVICVAAAGITLVMVNTARNREEARSVSEWTALGR